MKKAVCPKCNKLINVDEASQILECPECHEQINGVESIKHYNRLVNTYKRKAEIAFLGSTEYRKAFDNYSKLLALVDNALTVLTATSLSKLYCSDLHNIYIKEATDILIKGSDKVEINDNNAHLLSEFLKKFKEDCLLIVNSLAKYKNKSIYSNKLYLKSVEEYIYYLKVYLDIYNSLDKMHSHFIENNDVINKDIESANELLKEKFEIKENTSNKHDFLNSEGKPTKDIFPNKKKIYNIRLALYGSMGVGFITTIVGLILVSTNKDNKLASGLVAAIGLVLFVGSYFIGNALRRKNYGTTY